MLKSMSSAAPTNIAVIDFRRQSMVLNWHSLGGTWSASDVPPPLVHGVALIRSSPPNICVFGQSGQLHLQVGADRYALSEISPRIKCTRGLASFGFRRRFTVQSSSAGLLFDLSYWTNQGRDFFRWLALRADDPDWRTTNGRLWSVGLEAVVLRSSERLRAISVAEGPTLQSP